jgi:2Fe-2S ferredoxin
MAADRPAFRVRFLVEKIANPFDVAVSPDLKLDGFDGEPGSLLQIALSAGVPIEHACGGVGACGTCHVIVEGGFESVRPADEHEQDGLDSAVGVTRQSRLACQAVPTGSADLVVRVPAWNRNLGG